MKKKYYIDLGKRLTKVWRALDIDKKEMAKAAGIVPGYLTDLCKGSSYIKNTLLGMAVKLYM